jgi:hypothetical protein
VIHPIRLVDRTATPIQRRHRRSKIDPEAEDRLSLALPLELRRHHTAYVTRLRATIAAREALGTLVERDDLPSYKLGERKSFRVKR